MKTLWLLLLLASPAMAQGPVGNVGPGTGFPQRNGTSALGSVREPPEIISIETCPPVTGDGVPPAQLIALQVQCQVDERQARAFVFDNWKGTPPAQRLVCLDQVTGWPTSPYGPLARFYGRLARCLDFSFGSFTGN